MTTVSLNNAFVPLEQLVTLPDRPLHCDAEPVTHDSDEEIIVIDDDVEPTDASTKTTMEASNADLLEAPAAASMEQQQPDSSSDVSVLNDTWDLNIKFLSGEDSTVSGRQADEGEGRSDGEQQGEAVIDVDDSFEKSTSGTQDARAAELSVAADANVSSTLPVIKQWKKHASTICDGYEMMLDARVAGSERRNWYCPWSLHCGSRAVSDGLVSPLREISMHNHPPGQPPEGAPAK
ncbi:hypothetical protein AAVH_36293, partial [Aphelenchoides avenae]